MGRLNYKELAKASTKKNRNVVISEAYDKKGESVGYVMLNSMLYRKMEKK